MQASLMITCLCDGLFPEVGKSAVRVLRKLGVTMEFPKEQTCCGQPAFNSGYQEETRKAALAMIRAFRSSSHVVSLSGSCAGMIRHNYPRLFSGRPEEREAETLAAKTYEFSEFLTEVLKVEALPVEVHGRATFHNSCHTRRWLGVSEGPEKILQMVKGLEVVPLKGAEDCCGFGGTFAVKMPRISTAMVDEKVEHILETGADLLVSLDMSCLMNIGGRLQREGHSVRVMHLAQLLDEGWLPHGR